MYLGFLLFYGIYQGFRVKSAGDFAVTDKKHGLFVVFSSLSAAFIGGGFSTGNATETFSSGVGNIVGLWGFSLGQIVVGVLMVRCGRLPEKAASPGEILFSVYGKAGQVTAGICSVLLCAGILGAQIAAIGTIFLELFNVPYNMGVLIGFSVVIIYSAAGGMNAIITAEILEFLLLMVGMPLLAFAAVKFSGGFEAVKTAVPPEYFNPINDRSALSLISLFLTMAIGEALTPTYLQRMLVGKERKIMGRATILSGVISIPFFVVTGIVGLAAYAVFPELERTLAMPHMVFTVLPIGIKGLVMTAMLAIVMSSADGLLSSAAIGAVSDIIAPLMKKQASSKSRLKMMRMSTVLIGIVGMAYALLSNDVFGILLFSYFAWAPVMLVPTVAAVFGFRSGKRAFAASAICGAAVALLWGMFIEPKTGVSGTLVGTLASFAVFITVGSMRRS